jgi:hypothetical protein
MNQPPPGEGPGPGEPEPAQNGVLMRPAPPPPVRPNDAQAERLQKLRAAILKQRSQQQQTGNQGEH